MKKIVILIISVVAFSLSANAQIVSAHYNDSYGSPYFRVDVMKSSLSYSEEGSFIPTSDGLNGLGINASIGYYIPISRTYFFYAPEIGLTGRMGNDRVDGDDTYYTSYLGVGLKLVPLQFGYSFEVTPSVSVNPGIGMSAALIPVGSVTHKSGESSSNGKWTDSFSTFGLTEIIGCDIVFKDSNFILSLQLESGEFSQAGIGLGLLF